MLDTLEFAKVQVKINKGKPREAMWQEIVEALEEREQRKPKEPVFTTVGDEETPLFDFVLCPTCGTVINRFNGDFEIEKHSYCSECGQKIDWRNHIKRGDD